jgi:hypothetical protein
MTKAMPSHSSTAVCVCAALLLAACAGSPTPPPAPSATLAPASPTATPGVSLAPGEAWQAALLKTAQAASYRTSLSIGGKGNLLGLPTEAPGQPSLLLRTDGEFSGRDAYFTVTGSLAGAMAGGADRGLAFVTAGGRSFVRGPVAALGAPEAGWYALPAERQALATPPFTPAAVNQVLAAKGSPLPELSMAGMETLDGQPCARYAADRATALTTLSAVAQGMIPNIAALASPAVVELAYWVCEDGYLHRMALTAASSTENPAVAFEFDLRFSDFGAQFNIAAPENAQPLQP